MTATELIALLGVIVTLLGVVVTAIIGVPKFLELHERRRQRERTAHRKLCQAKRLLKKAKDVRWEPLTLEGESASELEEEAIQRLEEALEVGPSRWDTAQVWFELGRLNHLRGEYQSAEEELSRAIRLNRKLTAAFEERGVLRWGVGDFQNAIKDMERAQKLCKGDECEGIERRLQDWRSRVPES